MRKFRFFSIWGLFLSLGLVLTPLPSSAAGEKDLQLVVDGRVLQVPIPEGFHRNGKHGGILSLLGPVQQDGSIPAVFLRSYEVPESRGLDQLMRLVEDRYRRLEGYARQQENQGDRFIRVERSYHYPSSELGIHELAGYRREGNLLLEVRCVSSAMARDRFHDAFDRLVRETRFLPGAGESSRRPGADPQTLARIDLAVELVERESWVKGEQVIRELLQRSPGAEELQILLARCLAGQNRHLEAVVILETVVESRPDVLAWQNLLVEQLIRGGDLPRAAERLKLAEHKNGLKADRARRARLAGELAWRQEKKPEAIAAFETGLALAPQDPDLHGSLAMVLEELGRATEAVIHYREAVSRRSTDLSFRRGLGRVLYRQGEYANALYQFLYLSRSRPEDTEALSALYHCYRRLGAREKALAVFQRLRRLRPSITPEGLAEP